MCVCVLFVFGRRYHTTPDIMLASSLRVGRGLAAAAGAAANGSGVRLGVARRACTAAVRSAGVHTRGGACAATPTGAGTCSTHVGAYDTLFDFPTRADDGTWDTDFPRHTVDIIAHRGSSGTLPGHTLPSYDEVRGWV